METPRLRNRLWRRRTKGVWGISGERCQACFGVEYYSDLNQIKYHGCFFHDMHFGMGVWIIERDLSSIMDWKRDRPYSGQYDHRAVDNHTKEVIIPNNSLKETCSFILPSFLHSLKHIVIGNDCFGRVRPIPSGWTGPIGEDWDPNEKLHSFKRLSRCLLQYSERWFLSNPELFLTHSHSFCDCCSFELSNLHILDIGENCFYNAVSFILAGWCNNTSVLPRLWCFFVGYASSYSCQTIAFEGKSVDRLRSQTCLSSTPFKWVRMRYEGIGMKIGREPSYSLTPWRVDSLFTMSG